MEDCIDSLGDAKYFTTLDCNAGYWQIPVAPGDRGKTAFVCHEGCFEYCRMPFGLTNAPATFQRAIDMVLGQYRWKTCLVYLDDIIVFSRTAEEHIRHVEEVLTTLQDAGFSLKLRKCEFFAETVDYLGHVIRPERLQVAQQKIEAVKGFKMPTTQTELRSFLGLCNVYRRFVPNFARAAAPLNDLLKKGQAFELPPLDEKQRKAFDSLKQALIEPTILRLPQSDLEYSVDTDACNHQVGCALLQTHEDGTRTSYWLLESLIDPSGEKLFRWRKGMSGHGLGSTNSASLLGTKAFPTVRRSFAIPTRTSKCWSSRRRTSTNVQNMNVHECKRSCTFKIWSGMLERHWCQRMFGPKIAKFWNFRRAYPMHERMQLYASIS